MADLPQDFISPVTGKPLGGETTTIDKETDKAVAINPVTGKAFSSVPNSGGNRAYIGGLPGRPVDVGEQMLNSQHSVKLGEDISKFTDYNVPLGQDLDWQELRARNQSTSEKWGRGLAKAGVTTLGAVAENTIGVLFGLGELATGGAYYDNAIGKSIDKTNEWMREEMPNYLTAEEQKMSTMSKLGTANFWADTVASGLGYSIGSIATMWLTGGGGLIAKGVSAAAKGLGIYRAAKAVINGTKLAQKLAKGGSGFARSAQMLEAGALMSLAEASVEARETQKSVYSDLVQDYMNENNLGSENEIGSDLLKDFEDVSYAAGNTNFVSQMPVLMGSNLLMFGKQVAGFKAASNVSKDVAWDVTAKKAISKLADQSVWRQALSRMKPTALGSLEEAAQEGFQYASGHFASSYHKDKHHNGGYGDMSKSLSESISETFGTQEGLESMFVGALTGGLMGSAQSTISGDYANRKTNADALAKFSNGGYLQNVEAKYQSANASAAAVERMDKYLKEGNIKKFKDEQFRLISFQALEALERGGFDVMMEKLNDAKGLDPGQFMEHFGYQTTDKSGNAITLEDQTGGKSQSEVIEGLKAKLENFKTVYDNVGTRFPLDDKTTGLPRMLMSEEARTAEDAVYAKQSALRAELIITGAEVKDRTNRMKSIKTGLGNIIDGSLAENAVGNANNTNAPVTDSEGLALKLDAATMNHSENNPGEMDADMFDANGQFDFVQKALHSTYLDLFASDPIAAERFHAEASDYLSLLNENKIALDGYNKLSSDEYARNQFEIERIKAEDISKKKAADLKVESAISDSKTAEGLKKAMPEEGYSAEAGARSEAKYKELKAAENKERDTFLKASLEDLEKLDREKLSEVEVEGLKSAIEIKKGQQEAATDKIKEEQRDKERAEEQELEQAHEDKQKEVEEAFRADNVGDVEIISENGRSFQIEGEEYTNVEVNPLDALSIDKDGNIIGVNLVDSQGNSVHFSGPETRVDALAYSIIMAESAVAEGNQELTKEEVIEKVEVFEEEIAVEISTVGDRGKHGIKDSGFIREEIHALERGLQEALEAFDQLRAYYIQEENATKDELKADPKLKALKRTVNSIRAQIGARKRILKARNVTFVPSSAEVLKVERDALDLVAAIEEDLAKAEADAAASAAEAEIAEKAAADAKASEDVDAYVNASKEYRILMKMVEEAKALISKLKRKINYHRKKLIRLENEKSNDLPGDAEQSAPETSGETEEQIDERKDTNTPKKPQAQKTDVNRVKYTKNGKTGIYYVSTDSDGQPQVFTAGSTTPTVFLKGQEKDRMKIIGKWHVQTGNALVITHENKAFIVLYKGVTANGKTGIIQEDGTYVNADTVNDDIKKKVAYAAIIKKANDLHAKRVANTTTTESDAALKKGEETKEAVVSIKKSAVETKGTPGPTGGGIQKISKGEEFESDPNMPSINKESLREFESEEGENILDEGDNVDDANRLDELFGPQPTLAEQLGKAKEKKEPQDPQEDIKEHVKNSVIKTPMLHGTETAFEGFSDDKSNLDFRGKDAISIQAAKGRTKVTFFSKGIELASQYANQDPDNPSPGARVIEAYLDVRNPLDITDRSTWGALIEAGTLSRILDISEAVAMNHFELSDSIESFEGVQILMKMLSKEDSDAIQVKLDKPGAKPLDSNGNPINEDVVHSEVTRLRLELLKAQGEFKISQGREFIDRNGKPYLYNARGKGNNWSPIENMLEDGTYLHKGRRGDSRKDFKGLRSLGYDAVINNESGFTNVGVFNASQIKVSNNSLKPQGPGVSLQAPTAIEKPAIMNADDFVRGNTFEIKDSSSPLQQQAVDFMVADALKAGMDWKIGPNRSNVAGREVVEVIMPNGMTFLMYRSTGTGSSSDTKGLWVPIPGFAMSGHFIKVYDTNGIDPKFSKYNVPLFKSVANTLESLDAKGKNILELEAGWKPVQALRDIVVPEMNIVEPNLNPTPKEKNTFGVKSASDAYVIMEDSVDMAGKPVRRSKLEVSENGTPRQHEPDTVDGVPIPMDKTLLSSSGPLFGREVTFEVIVNDYAKESPDRQTPFTVPIYYKLDGVIVGKLESGNSSERAELVDALQRGEEVTMEITDVIAGNFNHSRTSDGGKFFSNPAEVFDNPILVFTEVIEDMPQWTFGETSEDKGITDALHSDISTADNAGVDNGQVGIVVRGNRTPQGRARLSIASTADLAPVAQGVVMNLLKEGKFEQASEIIANSLYADSSKWANSFLQFGNFTNGAGFLVYKSPSTGDIIRITDANMKEAGKGKTYSADIVKLTEDEQAFTKVKVVPDSVDVVEDITNFVKMKKYHVSRGLGNSAGAYTSQVTGKTYDSYQGYLFAEEEIGSKRGIGKGHHSILTTDMVEMDGSLFHNPQIEFDAGNLKGTTVKGKLESPVRDVKGTTFSENPVEGMEGLNFGDNFKKDEMDQDCPF